MINILNLQNKIISQNIQPVQHCRLLNLSTNPLKPLSEDTVSFSARKYDVEREKGSWGKYTQSFKTPENDNYKVVYYSDVSSEYPEGVPYPPSHVQFKEPIDIQKGLDICEQHMYGFEEWQLKDIEQVKILKEFIQTCDELKDEKLVSLMDAMNSTIVLELEGNRVLKMIKYNPFPVGRNFEPSFDLPVLSDVYSHKGYYMFVQEKADTDDIDSDALDSVIERIEEAGYEPYDIIGNEMQVGWSEIKQDYMLLDTECARVKS